jgi:hypothetical protein
MTVNKAVRAIPNYDYERNRSVLQFDSWGLGCPGGPDRLLFWAAFIIY